MQKPTKTHTFIIRPFKSINWMLVTRVICMAVRAHDDALLFPRTAMQADYSAAGKQLACALSAQPQGMLGEQFN